MRSGRIGGVCRRSWVMADGPYVVGLLTDASPSDAFSVSTFDPEQKKKGWFKITGNVSRDLITHESN